MLSRRQILAITSLHFLLSGSLTSEAAQDISLRQLALNESQNSGTLKQKASEVQMNSGVLVLQDPLQPIAKRSWKYFVGVSAQQFQPQGKASNELHNFDLNTADSSILPSLQMGFVSKDSVMENITWHWGARLRGGLTRQAVANRYPSGLSFDSQLQSSVLSVGPLWALKRNVSPHWEYNLTPEVGSMNYTQSSSTEYGKFSKSATFAALSGSVNYKLNSDWGILAQYSRRQILSSEELEIQKDNFEVGTEVTW